LLQFYDGLCQSLVLLCESSAFSVGISLCSTEGVPEFVDFCKVFLVDGLDLCIFVFEDDYLLLVVDFEPVAAVELSHLLLIALHLHPQLLVLLRQSIIRVLQLLNLLVALLVALLHSHDLLYHLCLLWRRLLPLAELRLFVSGVEPLVVALCGGSRTQK
jgi:hypothetical protein